MRDLYHGLCVMVVVIGALTANDISQRRDTLAWLRAWGTWFFAVIGCCVWGPMIAHAGERSGMPPGWAWLLAPVGLFCGAFVGVAMSLTVWPWLFLKRTDEHDDPDA